MIQRVPDNWLNSIKGIV